MRRDYKAVFVGIGAQQGIRLRIPGEDAPNVFTGTEFLNRVNSGEEPEIGGKVIVDRRRRYRHRFRARQPRPGR